MKFLSNINQDYIVDYIRSLVKDEENLKDVREYGDEHNVPIIQPEVKQLLKVLVSIKKPMTILEVGTAIGYSSMVMAGVMPEGGKIYTIERNESLIEIAGRNIAEKGFGDRIEILEGEAKDILAGFDRPIDMVFLDGAKGQYEEFLGYIFKNLNDEGIIVADNVLFKGMIASDELVVRRKKTIVKRMRSYLEYVSNMEELETSIIPIGDGMSISYKRR